MAVEDKVRLPQGVAAIRTVPRSVVALGFVSLFMDISSEIVHSLLPVFLIAVLGASALSVGLIEGIAEATSQVTKLFAGAISDWIGKAEATHPRRLRARRPDKILVPARIRRRRGDSGSLFGSDREGYSRCPSRCPDR